MNHRCMQGPSRAMLLSSTPLSDASQLPTHAPPAPPLPAASAEPPCRHCVARTAAAVEEAHLSVTRLWQARELLRAGPSSAEARAELSCAARQRRRAGSSSGNPARAFCGSVASWTEPARVQGRNTSGELNWRELYEHNHRERRCFNPGLDPSCVDLYVLQLSTI